MDQVEEIKNKIDIVQFISEYVPLKKGGRNFKANCPFHNEKTPSFMVSPERQSWHCFGACQTGGDVFKFLMKMENMEFAEALRTLAKRAGVTLQSFRPTEQTQVKELIFEINHLASEYYHYILTSHPVGKVAREYLDARKITEASGKLFGLGYAPDSWDSLANFLQKKGYKMADLVTAGLVTKSEKGHFFDRFRGRVMFSLLDHRGNAVGFAGRLLDPNAKEAKYINTAETPVYIKGNILYGLNITKEGIRKTNTTVVVEGEIDLIQSYQAGVMNVVAIKGTALTEAQVNLLKRYAENIILSLDTDLAGDAAAHRGIQTADAAGLNIKVATFDEAKDPDELIKKDPNLWREAIKKAVPFYDYVIDSAVKKHGAETAEGKKGAVAETAKFLGFIENAVVKNHYVKKLAKILGAEETDVEKEMEKEIRRGEIKKPTEKVEENKTTGTRREKLEKYLLAIILQTGNLPSGKLEFSNAARESLFKRLKGSGRDGMTADFIGKLPAELQPLADELYLYDLKNPEPVEKVAKELAELERKKKLDELSQKIKAAKNSEEEERLTVEFNKLLG